MTIQAAAHIDDLRRLVELHDVVYEVRPHQDVVKFRDESKIVKNGFDLTLCGTHDHGQTEMNPGCCLCVATYRDLRTIARSILPTETRPSSYDIQCFDMALHRPGGRERRLEVDLTVQIRHRSGWTEPIDDCERLCLREMEDKLNTLGVRRR